MNYKEILEDAMTHKSDLAYAINDAISFLKLHNGNNEYEAAIMILTIALTFTYPQKDDGSLK